MHKVSACGDFDFQGFSRFGPPRSIIDLHLGNVGRDVPIVENLAMVPTFLNQFVKEEGSYLAKDFQILGGVHSF